MCHPRKDRFDDTGDPVNAVDASATANHGTISGALYTGDAGGVTGAAGDFALSFEGDTDFVTLDPLKLSSISANNAVTVSLWIFGVNQPRQDVAFWLNSGPTRNVQSHLPWDGNNVYFDTGGCSMPNTRFNGTAPAASLNGAWNHGAFVKSGNDQQIYVNGNIFLQQTGTSTAPIGAFTQAVIGAASIAGALSYEGLIDDFAFFDEGLSQTQIPGIMGGDFSPCLIPEPSSAAQLLMGFFTLRLFRRR
ncbi:MAG: hypothetical protein ACI9QL_002274 [Candidatus Omnitrophota bacterium]